jgi:hypothetical protein
MKLATIPLLLLACQIASPAISAEPFGNGASAASFSSPSGKDTLRQDRTRMFAQAATCVWGGMMYSVGARCASECDSVTCKSNLCKADGTWEFTDMCRLDACPRKC